MAVPIPQPQNAQDLERWLMQMSEPDTAKIMQATAVLKQFIKKSTCVVPLIQQIAGSQHPAVRHMAAVLLRLRIHTHFKRLTPEAQTEAKNVFLSRLQQEPVAPVRFGVAALISSLAKATVPSGQWPELLSFLLSLSQSTASEHREIAMILFRALTDDIGPSLKQHFRDLQSIFQQGLADSNSARVRLEALKALGALVDLLEPIPEDQQLILSYRQCIPPLLGLLTSYFNAGPSALEEVGDAVTAGFELFDSLADAAASGPMLDEHLPALVSFMREVMLNQQIDLSFRDHACQFLITLLGNIPESVVQKDCVPTLINSAAQLCSEPFSEDSLDPTQQTPQKLGVDLLDGLAEHVPAKLVFMPTLQLGVALARSANPLERKAGLVLIGVLAEHLADCFLEPLSPDELAARAAQPQAFHRPSISELLQVISAGVIDKVPLVREMAHMAITQFVDHLRPDIMEHRQTIVQHCFVALDAPEEEFRVKVRAVVTLQTVAEYAPPEDLEPLTAAIMGRMMQLLEQWGRMLPPPPPPPQGPDGQLSPQQEAERDKIVDSPHFENALAMLRCVIHCIQAVCDSLQQRFSATPYFQPLLGLLHSLMQRGADNDDEMLPLRARATETIGSLLVSAGKQNVPKQLLQELLNMAIISFKLDYVPLREAAHIFFGRLAQLLDRDFALLLPTVLAVIMSSIVSEEGLEERQAADPLAKRGMAGFAVSDDEGSVHEDDLDDGTTYSLNVRTAILDEKLAALRALQDIIVQTQDLFLPYLANTMKYVEAMTGYPHADLRKEVIDTFVCIVNVLRRCFPNPQLEKPIEQPPNVAAGDLHIAPLVQVQIQNQKSLTGASQTAASSKPLPRLWVKGSVTPLHPFVQPAIALIVKELLDFMEHEESRDVAAAACNGFQEVCMAFGLGAIYQSMDRVATLVLKYVNERARCQRRGKNNFATSAFTDRPESLSNTNRSPDLAEHDEVVIDAVIDTVVVLAKIGGEAMTAFLKEALQPIARFLDPKRPAYDRSMAIGCFSDVADELPSSVAPFVNLLMPIALQGVSDASISMRRNSAFCVGTLCLRFPQQTVNAQTVPAFAQALAPLFGAAPAQYQYDVDDWLACKDNACSAVAKLILADPSSEPNMQLIELLISGLPLVRDQMEAKYVYPCLVQLFAKFPRVIFPHLPKVVEIMSWVLGSPVVDAEAQTPLLHLARSLLQQCGAQMQAVVQSLPTERQQQFMQAVNSAS